MAQTLRLRRPKVQSQDEITACYLDSAVPALLDTIVKYTQTGVWQALLANANTGGENVHRGSCLGAILGATSGSFQHTAEPQLVNGLYQHEQLEQEIRAFVQATMRSSTDRPEKQQR